MKGEISGSLLALIIVITIVIAASAVLYGSNSATGFALHKDQQPSAPDLPPAPDQPPVQPSDQPESQPAPTGMELGVPAGEPSVQGEPQPPGDMQILNVNTCRNITVAGTYNLDNNLSNVQAASWDRCLYINASNVYLDCGGNSKNLTDFVGDGDAIYVNKSATNVTITNCYIYNYANSGILLSSTNYSKVFNNFLNGTGIEIWDSFHNNVSSNNISQAGSGILLSLGASTPSMNNTIFNNNISANYAIYLWGPGNNILRNVITTGNQRAIDLALGTSDNNVIDGNVLNVTDGYGIFVTTNGVTNSTIKNNTLICTGASGYGIWIDTTAYQNYSVIGNNVTNCPGAGINILSGNLTKFENNTVTSCDLSIDSAVGNGGFLNNTTIGNVSANITYGGGIRIRSAVYPGSNATGQKNIGKFINISNTSANTWVLINISYNSTDIINNKISDTSLRIWKNSSGVWSKNLNLTGALQEGVDRTKKYVYANISNFSSIFAPMGSSQVSECTNLTSADTEYSLANNLTGNQSHAICVDVQADNVTLDCAGYGINGTSSGTTYGTVTEIYNRTTIKNCRVTNYSYGIYFHISYNNTAYNNTAYNNTAYGLAVSGGSNNTLYNNTAYNDTTMGIYITSSNSNVTDNKLYSNAYGLGADTVVNSTFRNNTAYNNGEGFYLYHTSQNNTFANNTAYNNSDVGIFILSGFNNTTVVNSTVYNNSYGIYISQASNNTFTNNNISFNNAWDFYSNSSSNNTVTNMTTNDTTSSFTYAGNVSVKSVTAPVGGYPSKYRNVSKYLNATINTAAAGDWMLLNISYNASLVTERGLTENQLIMMKNNTTGWFDASKFANGGTQYGVNTANDYVWSNITNFGSVFAPLGDTTRVSDCMNLTIPYTDYSLSNNLTGVQAGWDRCIYINVSNVTLDCGGVLNNITGTTRASNSGIYVDNTIENLTIKNCYVIKYYRPIHAEYAKYANITNNTLYDADVALHLDFVDNSSVSSNNVSSFSSAGIQLNTGENNTIIDNNASNTTSTASTSGIWLLNSRLNNMTNNLLTKNCYGIYFVASDNNTVYSNTPFNNSYSGVRIERSSNNTIYSNNVSENYLYAFYIDGSIGSSDSNNITNNTMVNISFSPVRITATSRNNTFANNNATSLKDPNYDFYSDSATGNVIINYLINGTNTNFTYGGSMTMRKTSHVSGIAADPAGYRNISEYRDLTGVGWVFLNISYNASLVAGRGMTESGLIMFKNNTTGWYDASKFASSYGFDNVSDYVWANITNFGSVFAPMWQNTSQITGCVNLTTNDTYYTLATNLSKVQIGQDYCINITASNVTLDCGGIANNLTGNKSTGCNIGIAVGYSNTPGVRVNNVTVKNCYIYKYNSENLLVQASDGTTFTDGALINASSSGAWMIYNNNFSIINTTINYNDNNGVYVFASNYSNIINNSMNNNSYAISMTSSSDDNITNNTITNASYGISVNSLTASLIDNNTIVRSTSDGINGVLHDSNITNNNIINTSSWAIGINGYNNIVSNNTVNRATLGGIAISQSNDSMAANNVINDAQSTASIYTGDSRNITFINNNVSTTSSAWDYYHYPDSVLASRNITVINLTSNGTIMSFNYNGSIKLRSASTAAADPSGYKNVSKYVNATNETRAWLMLNITYNATLVSERGMTEAGLIMFKNNTTGWFDASKFANGYGVDTANDYVWANITNFGSIFAPMWMNTSVDGCRDLTVSNTEYTLVRNLTGRQAGKSYCIRISVPNVTLDCGGQANNITSNSPGNDNIGIWVYSALGGFDNVTVKNCYIVGYDTAIDSYYINHLSLINDTSVSATYISMWLEGYNDNLYILNNTVDDGDYKGIMLEGGNNVTIINSTIKNTKYSGGGDGTGLYLTGNYYTAKVYIANNNFTSNYFGVELDYLNNATLDNNNITNSTSWDFVSSNIYNVTAHNFTLNNTTSSFSTEGSPFMKNVVTPPADPAGYNNISQYLNITNYSTDTWMLINMSYDEAYLTSLGLDEPGLIIMRNGSGTWDDASKFASSYGVNTANNYTWSNITSFGIDYVGSIFAPMWRNVSQVTGCTNLTSPDVVYELQNSLTGNQTRSSGYRPCIDVQADNVTLECGVYNITGNVAAGNTVGIYINNHDDVRIKNCDVSRYYNGIGMEYSENVSVNDSTIDNNTGVGIDVAQNSYGFVADNDMLFNNSINGIYISSGSTDSMILNSVVTNSTSAYGISIVTGASFINNTTSAYNYGGVSYSQSSDSVLSYSNMSYNDIGGVLFNDASNNNILENNEITDNQYGIYNSDFNNNFTDNNVSFNTEWDYYSDSGLPDTGNIIVNMLTNDTNVSFTHGGSFTIKDADTPAPDLYGFKNISQYLNVTGDTWAMLNVSYDESDLIALGIDENYMIMMKENSSGWHKASDFASSYGVDTANNYTWANITDFSSIFAPMEQTPVPPYWLSESTNPPTPVKYSPGASYDFNITWLDFNDNFDNATFEINDTGVAANYTISTSPATVNSSFQWGIIFTSLPVGVYEYKWYGIDTTDLENSTSYLYYTVDQVSSMCTLTTTPMSPITYDGVTTTNATCVCDNLEASATLYRNDSDVNLTENGVGIILPAGSWDYVCNVSSTQNYTAASDSATYLVNQNTSTGSMLMNLTINGTEGNKVYAYPAASNITGYNSVPELTFNLYMNTSTIGSSNPISDVNQYGAGLYMYTYNTSGNANYSSASKQYNLTINKIPLNLVLTLNGTHGSRPYMVNTTANFTAVSNVTGRTVNLTTNITGWGAEQTGTTLVTNTTNMTVLGVFNITAYTEGDENVSGDSETWYANVVQGIDLEISNLTFDPEDAYIYDSVRINANVTNIGPTNATNTYVDFYIDDKFDSSIDSFSPLEPGQSVPFHINKVFVDSDTYKIYAVVRADEIDFNESNNNMTADLEISRTSGPGPGPGPIPVIPSILVTAPTSFSNWPLYRLLFNNCSMQNISVNMTKDGVTVLLQGSIDDKGVPSPNSAAVLLYPEGNATSNTTFGAFVKTIRCISPEQYAVVACNETIVASYEINVASNHTFFCYNYEGSSVRPGSIAISKISGDEWLPISQDKIWRDEQSKIICADITGKTPYMISGFAPLAIADSAWNAIQLANKTINEIKATGEDTSVQDGLMQDAVAAYYACDYQKALDIANQILTPPMERPTLIWILLAIPVTIGVYFLTRRKSLIKRPLKVDIKNSDIPKRKR